MFSLIAIFVFGCGILGLFALERDSTSRPSRALWIPVAWLLIAGSRPVSEWLGIKPPNTPDLVLEGSPLDRAVFTGLIALGLIVLAGRWQRVGRFLSANAVILLFLFYCAASVLWSDYPDVAFKRWIKAVGDVVMVLVVATDRGPTAAVKRLLVRTAFLLLPLSLAFINFLHVGIRLQYSKETFTGVTGDKNMLGVDCLVLGLGSAWLFLQRWGEKRNGRTGSLIAYGIVFTTAVWLLLKCDSMTALLSFVIGIGLIVLTTRPASRRNPALIHLFIIGAITVSLAALFLDVGILQTVGRDATLTGRTAIWNQVINMTTNPLLGAGFESFWLGERLRTFWAMYWFRPNEAHNGYLEVFLNLGWIGVALLAILIVT